MAAAQRHDVWLLTSAVHRRWVRPALEEARPDGLQAVWFLEEEVGPISNRGPAQLRYRRWQRAARRFVAARHAELGFDLAHHLTWAVDWQPAGVAGVDDLPYVWGPVGGYTRLAPGLLRWLGPRGLLADVGRELVTRPARRLAGDRVARGAALVLAQNHDVAHRFRRHGGELVVAPHPAIRLPEGVSRRPPPVDGPRRAVYVGRLLGWKGLRLAIAAVARNPGWALDVYGRGPEGDAAERLAARLGAADRVTLHGQVARSEVLEQLAGADALLFPSLHDSAGWAVAEAVTLGVPVVVLDRGGPPDLVRAPAGGVVVPADRRAPAALAAALDDLPATAPVDWWSADRLPAEIDGYYRRAMAARRR